MSITIIKKPIFKGGKQVRTDLYYDFYVKGQNRVRIKSPYYLLTGKSKRVDDINDVQLGEAKKEKIEFEKKLKMNKGSILQTIPNKVERDMSLLNLIGVLIASKGGVYNAIRVNIAGFAEYQHKTDFSLMDFDYTKLSQFKDYMIKVKGVTANTFREYYNKLNAVFNEAVSRNLIEYNKIAGKLKGLGVKETQRDKDYLTANEVRSIISLNISNEKHNEVRKAFIFCCYTGITRKQVFDLTYSQISKENKLKYFRTKTGKFNTVDLHPKALEQIHSSVMDINGKVFPNLTYSTMNEHLAHILKPLQLNKDITFHSARRTLSTLLYIEGVNLKTIQEILDHSNISTTQLYVKSINALKTSAISKLPS